MVDGWKRLPEWMKGNRFFKKDLVNGGEMVETNPDNANLISSHFYTTPGGKEVHYPVIDLDMDAALIPSSTPGHHHLFINKVLLKEDYDKLLRTLHEVGIIQKGIIDLQWEQDGMTCARLPGIKKEKNSLSSGGKVGFNPDDVVINADNIPSDKIKEFTNTTFSEVAKKTQKADLSGFELTSTTEHTLNSKSKVEVEELTPVIKDAMIVFQHLAKIADETSKSLHEVVLAWKEFVEPALSENKAHNPPESPF